MRRNIIILMFILLALGMGVWLGSSHVKEKHVMTEPSIGRNYICPMHPQIIRDHPDKCPICGMELVLKTASGENISDGAVAVSATMAQSIGVQLAAVNVTELHRNIRIDANIEADPQRIAVINARAMGWIEQLSNANVGDIVKEGQLLALVHSPELDAAQNDFLQASTSPDKRLVDNAAKRLVNLGFSQHLIDSLAQKKMALSPVPIFAPISGIIVARNVVLGQNIMAGQDLFRIMNLSQVWAIGKAFPEDLRDIRVGQHAIVRIQGELDRQKNGRISLVAPVVDPATKTADVRVPLNNQGSPFFRPGQNATMDIAIHLGQGIAIANQNVIRTGERTVAYVSQGNGHFVARNLVLGSNLGDSVEVISGLFPGDSIVISAQFLLDAESHINQPSGAHP